MRTLRNHGLSLFFLAIFLAALVGQAFTGQDSFNHAQAAATPTRSRSGAT